MTAAGLPVKNVCRGPLYVDGAGFLEREETGVAADSEHTAAQLRAGLLINMPKPAKTASGGSS